MKQSGPLAIGFVLLTALSAAANAQGTEKTFSWNSTYPTDVQITPVGTTNVNVIVFGAQHSSIDAPMVEIFCADAANTTMATFYQRYSTTFEMIRLSPG